MPFVLKFRQFKNPSLNSTSPKRMPNNNPISKSPTKPITGTLKHQRSRILGRPSEGSLRSKYNKEEEPVAAAKEPTPAPSTQQDETANQVNPEPPTQAESLSPPKTTQPASDSWSIWPRKSIDPDTRPNSAATNSKPVKDPAVSDSEVPVDKDKDDQSIHSVSESVKQRTERENSWISWRKPSFTSLKRATEVVQSSDSQVITTDEEEVSSKEPIKAVAHEANVPNSSSSWSFWNNTVPATGNSANISNVLLNGGDALLFEPSEIKEEDPQPSSHQNKKVKPNKPKIPNKVVPEFETSLPLYTASTSIVNNYNRLKYTLGFNVDNPKHLYRRERLPSQIKKVVIIGVHGFFPTKVLRPLIGEPTGTSIKFANEAEKAIHRWAKRENLTISLQKIALEKEGKIFDRVNFFYEVIKKWKEDIQDADYIFVAAHSQGCPVSIILLARLIGDEIIKMDGYKRVSILAMAGINNGPFYGVDQKLFVRAYSTIENNSLMELFQFQNFESTHSKELLESLKVIIGNNVKITFVGSINDQLVPLYSSTCLHVRHPNIFRATYVDGSSNTPEFVSRAVSIANHLHNIGLSDHGLIKEISNSLAGPLTGGGHSRIYNDPQVYDLALNFSLYTSDLKYQIPVHFKPYSIEQLGVNPYHLPWCMRGLLFEARARFPTKLADEDINGLFEEFDRWNPDTKQLKDMKYRLNGIKSKL